MNELKERYNGNGELIKEVYANEYNELRHDFDQLQRQNDELKQQLKTAKQMAFIAGFHYANTGDHIDEEIKAEQYENNLEGK